MANVSSIGPTTSVRGNVQGDGDLEILGRVEGSVVMTGDVTIGEGALIHSDVRGRRVVVRGAVAGNVTGDEAVILEAGARVVGDLGAPQIGIRPGALVRGQVTTGGAPAEAARPAAVRPAAAAAPRQAPAQQRPAATGARSASAAAPPRAAPRAPAPAARPAPAVRLAPPADAKPSPEPRQAHDEALPKAGASMADDEAAGASGGPPPPVVPALRRGAAKAALKKKGGR